MNLKFDHDFTLKTLVDLVDQGGPGRRVATLQPGGDLDAACAAKALKSLEERLAFAMMGDEEE